MEKEKSDWITFDGGTFDVEEKTANIRWNNGKLEQEVCVRKYKDHVAMSETSEFRPIPTVNE